MSCTSGRDPINNSMAANGISTLQYKRARQDAKLAAAAIKRAATGRPSTLDISLLPTRYGVDNNTAGAIVNNAGTLVAGRPWTSVQ
jgi:hypothetical protein